MNAVLLYPFILLAGALQAAGNSMNARLRVGLVNPWLAATVSFSLIVFVFLTLFLVMPTPLPTVGDLGAMPWWAPLGGIAGAVAVFGASRLCRQGRGRPLQRPADHSEYPDLALHRPARAGSACRPTRKP